MTINKLFLFLSLSLLFANALAAVSDITGDTTCTIVSSLDKKETVDMPCHYEGSVGGSMSYAIQQLSFQLANGKTLSTNNSSSFSLNDTGEMDILNASITLDDQPAEVINLRSLTLKPVSQAEINKRYETAEPDFSNTLYCFKPIKQDNAFCVPYALIQEIS